MSTQLKKSYPEEKYFAVEDKTGLMFTVADKPGVLGEALQIFTKNGVNLTYINSKPSKFSTTKSKNIDFFVDVEGKLSDENIQSALKELKNLYSTVNMVKTEEVPWFPKSIEDLNKMGRQLAIGGDALSSDHPGFKDEKYRERREEIVKTSNLYFLEDGDNIPEVTYSQDEIKLWTFMWDKLTPLHKLYACTEFNESFNLFKTECGFNRNEIPQLKTMTKFLHQKTGTIYRPVGGLLTQREFLNGLAFRVFHSTQYIRHPSAPLYTPEPDIIHEILGHAPLFANKDFADFSQEVGLASLAASDAEIEKLGTIYWFTIEFGLCMQDGQRKAYGAGILSSPSEIEYAMSDKPKMHPFDLYKMSTQVYNVTQIQPNYFLAPSFSEMKRQVVNYADSIKKPFNLTYKADDRTIEIDRQVVTRRDDPQKKPELLF